MQKVLVLGAGLVAKPLIRHLLSKGYTVTVASNTPDRAVEMVNNHPNGTVVNWDIKDEAKLDALVEGHDLTVSLLPYVFHVTVAKHCVSHAKTWSLHPMLNLKCRISTVLPKKKELSS
jgi:saccharopine dehydrogenase-like NADP-dependent oxidoreductase